MIEHLVTPGGHRLGEARQAGHVFIRLGTRDETSLAVQGEYQALPLQYPQGVPHSYPARPEQDSQLRHGGNARAARIGSVENPRADILADAPIEWTFEGR